MRSEDTSWAAALANPETAVDASAQNRMRNLDKKSLEEGSVMLISGQIAPELTVETLKEARFDLIVENPSRMTLVCFYRGLHCPSCQTISKNSTV